MTVLLLSNLKAVLLSHVAQLKNQTKLMTSSDNFLLFRKRKQTKSFLALTEL